jgi:transposase
VQIQIGKDIKRTKNRIRRFLDFHGLNGDMKAGTWTDADYMKLRDMDLTGPLKLSLTTYLEQLEFLWKQHTALKNELRALCDKDRYAASVAAKQSVPGVGWYTAIRLTLEWGDMNRFASGKHIASYTGLTASEYSTGETVRRGRITGQGPSHVRRWLIECSWRAINKDPALLRKFMTVSRNSGSRKKAIVAVARKLAVRMRAIECAGTSYLPGVLQ